MEEHSVNRSTRKSGGPIIQSLRRGVGILELIAKNKNGAGLTMAEISRQIGLHISTTFHLVRTLTVLGYLVQDDTTREYRLGSKLFYLAASAYTETQLLKTATPLLTEITQQTGETSQLAILEQGEVIVIGKVHGGGPVQLSERAGNPRPAHSTAIGKVLLAYLPEAELKAFLDTAELKVSTPKTISSAPILHQELERVRRQGYAFDDEEFTQGIRCLAAPVRNFSGAVVAATGISGPVWRISLDRITELTDLVKAVAHRLSQNLGHADSLANYENQPRQP